MTTETTQSKESLNNLETITFLNKKERITR